MAMFLSRIKKALNLGTKSITQNGTYNASSDGYDGYSSVEVNVAGVTPTPITPSNATPAALTSGSAVTPTANGYAIESYTEVVPSNASPATLSKDSIYKIKTNGGKAVASITDVTPSSTPTSVSANDIIKIGGSGVIVDSVPTPTPLTPSNSDPATITSGVTYTATESGKAVKYLLYPTPSDSNPPQLNNTTAVYKISASGYLYSTIQKFKQGSVTLSTSSQTSVTLGFKPKYLCVYSTNSYYSNIYDENISTTQYIRATSTGPLLKNMDSNYNGGLVSINSNGFTCRTCTTSVGLTWKYIAIG